MVIDISEGVTTHGYETGNAKFGLRNMKYLLNSLRKGKSS